MNAPAVVNSDASDLAEVVKRARALLDDGDVIAAKMLAGEAYKRAKSAAQAAERFGAAEKLIRKAHQLQGDALLIETRAKIRIADEYDAAQQRGEAAKQGRKSNLPDGKVFTAEDAGLSHKEIHEARKLRDAERKDPGIAEKAIAARLAQGLEPTKAALKHSFGNKSGTKEERGDDLYETPREAVLSLLAVEQFTTRIWEPACGRGAISEVLEAAGHDVAISDLRDRGCALRDGELQGVADFMTLPKMDGENGDFSIVTNPPFGIVNEFILRALVMHRPAFVAMLLPLNKYCGTESDERRIWLEALPPARIHAFSRRLPRMHRDGWDGREAGSQMNTAWFVWERQVPYADADVWKDAAPYGRQTLIDRVDWRDHENWQPKGGWR